MPVDVCVRRWVLSTATPPDERAPRSVITTCPLPSTPPRLWVEDCRNSNRTFTCLLLWAATGSHPPSRTTSTASARIAIVTPPSLARLVPISALHTDIEDVGVRQEIEHSVAPRLESRRSKSRG